MGMRLSDYIVRVLIYCNLPGLLPSSALQIEKLYCRPPGFTVMPTGKYLAGGLQSGCTANSTGAQYILTSDEICHNVPGIFRS